MSNLTDAWHFPKETALFLKNLRAHNTREWFTEYKTAYNIDVKKPAEFFCIMMAEKLREMTGHTYDTKIFRVYRDVRFSKDKTPYNTHLHISFIPEGIAAPGWYFGLDPDTFSLGMGLFGFDGDLLETYHRRVLGKDGDALAAALGSIHAKPGFRISEPELKRVPRQFTSNHPHAVLLRRKGLTAWYDFDTIAAASIGDTASICAEKYAAFMPLFNWLRALYD